MEDVMKTEVRFLLAGILVILALLVAMFYGCAALQVGPAKDEGVPLVGLTWHNEPCTMILVPRSLPQKFIENANRYMEGQQRYKGLANLTFLFEKDLIITAWAIRECPAFISLGTYHMRTEKARYWIYSPDGKFREVDSGTHSKFMNAWKPEMQKFYCSKGVKGASITSVSVATEPMPTMKQIKAWKLVHFVGISCGPVFIHLNPEPSEYPIGYVHNHGVLVVQYGFLFKGKSINFYLRNDNSTWERIPEALPLVDKMLRDQLPKTNI